MSFARQGPHRLLGEGMRHHRQLAAAQVGQHQQPAREAPVLDLAHRDLAAVGDRADGDLERHRLLVVQAAAQELEAVAFHRRPQLDRAAGKEALQQLTPADVAVGQHHRVVHAVAQPDGLAAGCQRVAGVHRGHQLLLELGQALDVGLGCQVEHQRQVGLVVAQCVQRLQVVTHACVEVHQRMRAPEGRDLARQEHRRQRLAGDDAHAAAAQALQFLDLGAHLVQRRAALADVVHEQLASGRQPHAAWQALEDRRAQLAFDVQQAPVDRRRGHVQPLGRLADAARTGHFVDVAQESQVVHRGPDDARTVPAECCRYGNGPPVIR